MNLTTSEAPPNTGVCTATVPTVPAASCVPSAMVAAAWMLTPPKLLP
jgi:hypothetical protein